MNITCVFWWASSLFCVAAPFSSFSLWFFHLNSNLRFSHLTLIQGLVIQTSFVFQTYWLHLCFWFYFDFFRFFFLLHILFVVHLELQVCYFCNSTQLQHLPPSPQETIQHDQIFHGTNWLLMKHLKRQCKKNLCPSLSLLVFWWVPTSLSPPWSPICRPVLSALFLLWWWSIAILGVVF